MISRFFARSPCADTAVDTILTAAIHAALRKKVLSPASMVSSTTSVDLKNQDLGFSPTVRKTAIRFGTSIRRTIGNSSLTRIPQSATLCTVMDSKPR